MRLRGTIGSLASTMMPASVRVPFVLATTCLLACSGGGDSQTADANSGAFFDADPNVSTVFDGRIVVQAFLREQTIVLSGEFRDGPALRFATEADRVGDCRLMTYTPSFCEPGCGGFDVCIAGQCESFPERQGRGALEWAWPGDSMTVEPDDTDYYSASGTISEHGEVSLTVAGEILRVQTSEGPQATTDWSEAFSERTDGVTLNWSDPVDGGRVRLHMTDCSGSHGGVGEAEIICDGPDSGSLSIPESFLTALDNANWSRGECGSHAVVRYRAAIPQEGDFVLESQAPTGFFYRPDFD